MPGTPVPRWLEKAINGAVEQYPAGQLGTIVAASGTSVGPPLCIKYIQPKWAGIYNTSGKRLRVSTNPAFTWGTGTYVVPLAFPLSSAIFGRVGVVSFFDPTGWRAFDTTDRSNEDLYLQWVGHQRAARRAQLTMHTALYNQQLRDTFRINFRIDCVLFRPDQYNRVYTDATKDVWMNVTDWDSRGSIEQEWSIRFTDPRICVLVEEEFIDDHHGLVRRGLLNLTPPYLTSHPNTDKIAAAYHGNTIVRVQS